MVGGRTGVSSMDLDFGVIRGVEPSYEISVGELEPRSLSQERLVTFQHSSRVTKRVDVEGSQSPRASDR